MSENWKLSTSRHSAFDHLRPPSAFEFHRNSRLDGHRLAIHSIGLELPPAERIHRRPRQHIGTIEGMHRDHRSIAPYNDVESNNSLQILFPCLWWVDRLNPMHQQLLHHLCRNLRSWFVGLGGRPIPQAAL